MLPYLAAIGMLSSAEVGGGLRLALLAAYVAVMVAPALLALGARLLLPARSSRHSASSATG